MPQLVDVEGIGQVEFPDHYTPAMIQDYWKQNFQPRLQQEQRIQAGLEASRRPEDTPNLDALKSTARQMVADPAIDIARGVVGVPETAVGLLDIPTMGYTGKALENIPYGPRFGETKQILGDLYSPERKAAMEKVKEAKGFTPTLEAMVENPSTLVGTTLESLPSMFGGGALAQKGLSTLAKLGPRAAAFAAGETAPVVAGALGEGLVSAGQTAEQIREETPNRALTWDQAGLALASGALTGGIGVAAGKLAQKLGIENLHTLMARGKSSTTAKDLGERIAKGIGGAITEGFFEELPQSTQEQIAQNIALGKPWDEGVGEQAAAGLLAGAAMGGVAGAFGPGHHAPAGPQTPPPAAGPQAPAGPAPTTPSAPSAPITPPAPVPVAPLPQLPGMVLNTPIQNWTNPQARTSQHLLAVEPDAFSVGQAAVTTSPAGIFGVDQSGKDVRIPFGTPVTVVARTGPNYDGNPNSTASVLTANGVTAHIASNVLAPLEHFQQAQEQIAAAKGKPFEFTGKAPKSTPIQVTAPEPSGEPVKRTTPLSEAEKLVEQIAEARRKGDRATAVELSKRLDFLGAPKAESSMVAPKQAPLGIQRGPVVTPEIAAAAREALTYNPRVPELKRVENAREMIQGMRRLSLTNPQGKVEPVSIVTQTPTPKTFNSVEELLEFRRKRLAEEVALYQQEMKLTEAEAKELHALVLRDADTARFEKRVGPEKAARIEQFFEHSPYNKKGHPFEFWEGDQRLNPEDVAKEDQSALPSVLVSAVLRGVEERVTSDRYISAAIAARRMAESGMTKSDLARYIDQLSTRESSSMGDKAEFAKTLTERVAAFLKSVGVELKPGDLFEEAKKPQLEEKKAESVKAIAEPEYTVGSGVPYAGRIYRVLSVKGDRVHIQDSAVGGEKRWVSKGQLKLAQEMSRQQMPEEAPGELPIAPAQQFGRGDGFYITQKGLDIGEGPFNSRDEAAQFAESEVGGRVKIVEVAKGKLTGGPKRATVGRMNETEPSTSLATEMPSWEKTLEEKHALEQELKRRAMIFQHDAKQEAARFLGLPEDSLLGMSYAAWSDLSEKLNTLYNKASAEYNGPSNTTNGKVWSDYAKAHPEEVKAIKDSIKTPSASTPAVSPSPAETLPQSVAQETALKPEAAAPVLTPEEKLIAERSTPRPGTSERAALDAKWKAAVDAADAAYDKSSTLRDQAKASKYGSKVKEKLEAQATKAADEYARLKPAADEARTARQQAGIEDLAEQNIPIASDYAKRIAEANRTRTAPENPSARKKNWERAKEKEQIAYDIALEELEKAYLDRGLTADEAKAEAMSHASSLLSYPLAEGPKMVQRLDRMAEVVKEQREKNRMLAEFDAIENPVSGTQKDRLRDRVESKYGTLEESRKALEEYRRLAAENVAEAKRSEDAAAQAARENVERNTAELVSQPTSKFSIKDYGTERLEPGRFASNSAMMVDLDAAIPKEAKKFTTQTSAARGTTPQKAAIERVWKPVTSFRGEQLVPAGYRVSRATGNELSYYINPKDGGYWAIDRAVEGLIGRLFGEGLTIHQGAAEVEKTTPLVFFRGDKPVAVAMPFAHGQSTEIDAKVALGKVAKPSPQTITGSTSEILPDGLKKMVDIEVGIGKRQMVLTQIPVEWDGDVKEWLVTPAGREWIDTIKLKRNYLDIQETAGEWIVEAIHSKKPPRSIEEAWSLYRKQNGVRQEPTLTKSDFAKRWEQIKPSDVTKTGTEMPVPPSAAPLTQGREAGGETPTPQNPHPLKSKLMAEQFWKALDEAKEEFSKARPFWGDEGQLIHSKVEAVRLALMNRMSMPGLAAQEAVRDSVSGKPNILEELADGKRISVSKISQLGIPRSAMISLGYEQTGRFWNYTPEQSEQGIKPLTTDAAIKAIDELQKKIKGKQFSDPFLSTVWGPVALQVAKHLLRVGRPIEIAIREAIDKVRQQFPAANIDPQQAEQAIQTELATENEVLNAAERTKINRLEVDAAAEAIPHMASQQYADLESGYGTLEQAAFEKQQFRKAKSDLATLVNLADGAIRKLPDDRRHPDLYPKVTDGVSVTNGRVTVDDTFSNKLAALGVQHNPDNVKAMQAELYFEQLARKAADARERLQDLQDRLAYYQKIKAPDADIKRLQDLIAQNTTAASNAEAVALERNGADVLVGERTNELQQAEAKRMEAQAKVDALHIGPVAEFFGAGIAKLRNLFEKAKASAALIEELRKTTTDPEKLKALADEYRRYGDLPTTIEKAIAEDSPLNQRQQDAAAAELQKSLAEFNDARDEMNALLQQEEHTIIQQIEEAQKSFSKSANSVQENEALVQSALNAAKGDPALAHSVLAAAEINSLLNNVTAIANLAKHLGENLTQNRWLYDFLSGWRSSPGGSVTFSNLDAASLNVSPEVLQKVIDVASSSPSFASSIVALADAAAAAKAASVPIQLAGTLPSISDALKQGGKKGIDTAAQIASQFSRAVNPAITASRADNRQAARQINSLLTRLMALHHGANLFNNLAQSPQFQTLRQNIIVGSGGAPQQMIDRRPTGFTFREFGEAGKTPAHGEVILNVSEDPSSMERARKKMFAWFSAAEKYVAAYDQAVWLHALDPKTSKSPAELGFNESVARGLAAEIDVGRGEFLDQTFNRLKTTDSARKLMKLPLFRQHDAASRMVGGLVGAAMRSSLGRWVQGMMDSKRVMARFEDLPDLTSKALHSHYDPKNPKDNSYLNYDTYRKQVWNPMAHEGRKFDSDLKVGFQLPTGAIVTKEDIALLERSLVLNGMQRTEVSETNPLRGVHVTVGGKTYIRPSSSVGVFGMDRHLNRNANAFVADSTVAYRDTPGFDSSTDLSSASSNPVVQFWNNRNQMLIDHVVDSDRTDRKMKLDPAMQDAEKRLAALWKAGLETKPSNLAELVSQLATTLNPMAGVNPVSYVTERLNSELLNYQKEAARIQQERNDESTKNTGLKIALSADNEFTKPAAQLELPSSLYDYGALTPGERIARQSSANHQNLVEYANSVRRAIEELQTRLKRYNDGKLSAKEAAENYGGNVSEMKDTLEILRAILKDFEAAFSVNDPSLAPTRLASEISKWAVSGVLALPTVNFRNMTGGQFLVYLSDIAMGITLNRLALWNAVANMPKGLARLAYVWANGTAKFVDKNLVRHGNALEKVVDVVADAALAPARMALKNPAISTAGWKAQLEQVKNLGYDTKQGWVDAMKAAWLQSALFTNREEQEWAARNPKLAAANRAALTAAKTINAFFGSIGVENSDQVLNSLNLASAAALEQRLTEVARQYGKRLEDSGHTVFDPSDPAFQLKPSEWTTGGNEQARDDALANARLLFQTSASAEGFQLEHALWKFYQDEKAGRPASIYTDRQREAVTRTLLAMMNASLPTNRASVGAGNPLWRSVLTLQGYPADAMMKLINVSFGGTRDRRVAATIGAKLPMLFGIAAMMVLAGAAADGASEYWKRRMQAIQSAQAGVLDKDFWENKDKMASGVGRFLASNMFYLGDFILGMQNQVQGGKGFDPASRVFLVSVVNALTQAVRESYATYSGAGPASHVVQPFIDFAARLTPGANEIRKLFGDNTYEQQAKNVSRAEARSLGMELPKTGAAPSAGPTTVARRFLASAVGEMEEARRKNDQVAYQKAFTKAQEEIGYLQEYYVKHRTELGDSPADAEKHAKQAVWRDYQEINPVVAALGGRRPTAAELQSITSGPTGERAEAQQRGMEAWQAGAQALFGKTGATTKEEVASSRGGGIPANLSVPATGGGGGGGSTGTISTGRGAPSRLRSVRLGRLALRPHQPQKGRLSLSSAGSRLPRPRATTFKRLSLSTHIA